MFADVSPNVHPLVLSSRSGTAASPFQPDVLPPVFIKSVERALPQRSGHPEPSPHQATIASQLHAHPPTTWPMLTVIVSGSRSIIDTFVFSTAASGQKCSDCIFKDFFEGIATNQIIF